MASSANQKRFGTIYGTGALKNVDTVGFRPRSVRVQNENRIMLEWQDGMPDGHAFKTVAAGTRTLITSGGIIPRANGFSLGIDAINGNGEKLYWDAQE